MSREGVELIKRGFEEIKRGNLSWAEEMTHPDVVMVQPPEVPDAKTYEGRTAWAEAIADWPSQWEDFEMDLLEVIDVGDDTYVLVTRHRGRGRESGIDMDFRVFYVQRYRDGKLARVEMFFSREQALEAVGLSE
jgi:ketosteroid isomerase-like protein